MDSILESGSVTEFKSKPKVEERYSGLRIIVAILRILGIAQIAFSLIALLFTVFGETKYPAFGDTVLGSAIVFCGSALCGLLVYGFAELIQVVIDIEENTRRAVSL